MELDNEPKRFSKQMKLLMAGAIVVILIPFIYTGIMLYSVKQTNPFVTTMATWFPYPAAIIDGKWLLYKDARTSVADAISVTKKFAEDQTLLDQLGPLPADEELAKQEYERLISLAVLEKVAKTNDVTATPEDIDQMYQQSILSQVNGDESQVIETLDQLYGWTVDEFKHEVVRELVLRQKLQEKLLADNNEEFVNAAKLKITDVQNQVKADPAKFSDLAIQYSDDGSASEGGDLGFFAKGVMVPEFEAAAFALTEPNQVSEIVKTDFGFHLIQLIERKAATDTEAEEVHARHILVKYNMDDFLEAKRNSSGVMQLVDPKALL